MKQTEFEQYLIDLKITCKQCGLAIQDTAPRFMVLNEDKIQIGFNCPGRDGQQHLVWYWARNR